jgi:hypothetical protein
MCSLTKRTCAFEHVSFRTQDHVRASDVTFTPPYRILDHKIEDLSIKLQVMRSVLKNPLSSDFLYEIYQGID